ncbi:hypothetical protein D3C74_269030 [compost metagenome]
MATMPIDAAPTAIFQGLLNISAKPRTPAKLARRRSARNRVSSSAGGGSRSGWRPAIADTAHTASAADARIISA